MQALENHYGASHYAPLEVTLCRGKGCYVWDNQGKRYLDALSAYSALNYGHCHPKLIQALCEQATKLTLTSRAFYHDKCGVFFEKICHMTGFDKVLPMNTGAEAVETAIKAARKWAYTVKKIPENKAKILVCHNNFHGRTTTIISFSSKLAYKQYFGPLTPGFSLIPYGDLNALKSAITSDTAAFLIEPVQGEGGIILPPENYLKESYEICKENNVLWIADEIQTGLGRTGSLLACDHADIKPDGLLLGKALGGGVIPISLFLSDKSLMDVFQPGDHGSTFGGNPLASYVAYRALDLLEEEKLIINAKQQGNDLLEQLRLFKSPLIKEVRGIGLMIGLELDADKVQAKEVCNQLLEKGLLTYYTAGNVIRLTPPLIIQKDQVAELIVMLKNVLNKAG